MIKINEMSVKLENNDILKRISLEIYENEIVSILGPNGAGKSTLLRALLDIIPYQEGQVMYKHDGSEVDMHSLSRRQFAKILAYIPQENSMQFDYSVKEIIMMGRFAWIDYWGSYSSQDIEIVQKMSEIFKVEKLLNRSFNKLSGGEKQRVLLARAFAQDTKYVFLDETLSFLDINHQIEIMQLLRELQLKQGKTIVIVSHNINLSIEYSDRLVILKPGELLAEGKVADIITAEIIKKAYDADIYITENPITKKPNLLYSNKGSL